MRRSPQRWILLACALLCLGSPRVGALSAQSTASLELLVRDSGTGRPISGAVARLPGQSLATATDETGHALVLGIPSGRHVLEVAFVGYAPRSVELDFVAGETTQVRIPLHLEPLLLDGVEASGVAAVPRLHRVGFYQRIRVNPGSFILPAEMEAARQRGSVMSDILRGRRGLSVEFVPGTGYLLVSTRGTINARNPCLATIFVDGLRQPAVPQDVNRLISTLDVDAVEIYAGAADTPLQYRNARGCGAVVIWTRTGGR